MGGVGAIRVWCRSCLWGDLSVGAPLAPGVSRSAWGPACTPCFSHCSGQGGAEPSVVLRPGLEAEVWCCVRPRAVRWGREDTTGKDRQWCDAVSLLLLGLSAEPGA